MQGAKFDRVTLYRNGKEVASMDASYGYNVLLYSTPEVTDTTGYTTKVEKSGGT